jgi:NAD-dependent SIR2 family protein deacetylase
VELGEIVELLRGRRIVALTGAGCSTESGIPDYRSPEAPPRTRPSIQHREFIERGEVRRRYWARSSLGWSLFASASPNAGHRAFVALEQAGVLTGVITQNDDGLHGVAGSRAVVELHGALARVRCLACAAMSTRDELQARLVDANPGWFERARDVAYAPDGDSELPEDLVAGFTVAACTACGGTMMPDVVFFGGSVPRPTLDAAWQLFDQADALLVVGSSLAVFSGYRFVRRAAERGVPIAIVNRGPTRGDDYAQVRVDARAGTVLPALVQALA